MIRLRLSHLATSILRIPVVSVKACNVLSLPFRRAPLWLSFSGSFPCRPASTLLAPQSSLPGAEYKLATLVSAATSLRQVVRAAVHFLSMANVRDAKLSAEYMLAHVLGLGGRKQLRAVMDDAPSKSISILSEQQSGAFLELCRRAASHMPLQYVLGEWQFNELTLFMQAPVLIPRPETEELVLYMINHLQLQQQEEQPLNFLEVGCGSGAIIISLLLAFPTARATAVDISDVAIALTRKNAVLHGVADRLTLLELDICLAVSVVFPSASASSTPSSASLPTDTREVLSSLLGNVDVMVSNPPYIPSSDIPFLQAEVERFEDHRALDGGEEGFDLVKVLLNVAPALLRPPSALPADARSERVSRSSLWLEIGSEYDHVGMIRRHISSSTHSSTTSGPDASSPRLQFRQSLLDFAGQERFCMAELFLNSERSSS